MSLRNENRKEYSGENYIRRMAIPFKAKDVASTNTEFGHPDVALCFTHLSYYYAGNINSIFMQIHTILMHKSQNH